MTLRTKNKTKHIKLNTKEYIMYLMGRSKKSFIRKCRRKKLRVLRKLTQELGQNSLHKMVGRP